MVTDAIVKVCPQHGELRAGDLYHWTWNGKKYKRCHQCILDKSRRLEAVKKLDPQAVAKRKAQRAAEWLRRKDELTALRKAPKALAERREWYKANAETVRAKCKAKQAQYREELADPYIRKLIQDGNKQIKITDIPQSLVDFKRTLIQLKTAVIMGASTKLQKSLKEKLKNVDQQYRTAQSTTTRHNPKPVR